ncbi:hypothetical protein DSO57_1016465 [Entomophthora muscae]|uniref:Uncharacterized protein n=1 Tax=Entomophthora muscae TaxID=34485 RepID=A0ACC2U2Y8_9FUNG|nr:hypothetical protein DSO57_1016465 [Entomophthora muscae]
MGWMDKRMRIGLGSALAFEFKEGLLESSVFKAGVGANYFQESESCGICVRISTSRSLVARVVDQCEECGETSLSLDAAAFAKLNDTSVPARWHFVKCERSPNISLQWQDDSNNHFAALKVLHGMEPTVQLHYKDHSGHWILASQDFDSSFILLAIEKQVHLKLVSMSGVELIHTIPYIAGGTIPIEKQYSGEPGENLPFPTQLDVGSTEPNHASALPLLTHFPILLFLLAFD